MPRLSSTLPPSQFPPLVTDSSFAETISESPTTRPFLLDPLTACVCHLCTAEPSATGKCQADVYNLHKNTEAQWNVIQTAACVNGSCLVPYILSVAEDFVFCVSVRKWKKKSEIFLKGRLNDIKKRAPIKGFHCRSDVLTCTVVPYCVLVSFLGGDKLNDWNLKGH